MNLCHHVRYYRIYHYCARTQFHVDAVGTIERLLYLSYPAHRLPSHLNKGIAIQKVIGRLDLVGVQVLDERVLVNGLDIG
jgi:hypothetical protein